MGWGGERAIPTTSRNNESRDMARFVAFDTYSRPARCSQYAFSLWQIMAAVGDMAYGGRVFYIQRSTP